MSHSKCCDPGPKYFYRLTLVYGFLINKWPIVCGHQGIQSGPEFNFRLKQKQCNKYYGVKTFVLPNSIFTVQFKSRFKEQGGHQSQEVLMYCPLVQLRGSTVSMVGKLQLLISCHQFKLWVHHLTDR